MLAALEWMLREWNLRSLSSVNEGTEQELIQSLTARLNVTQLDLLPMLSPEKQGRIQFEIMVSDFVNSKGALVSSPAFCLSRSDFDGPQDQSLQRLHLNPRHELYTSFLELDEEQQLDLCQLCLALNQWPIGNVDYPERLEFHWGVRVLGGPIQLYSKAISEKIWVRQSPQRS
ncbi:MAG: hypothetical protein P1V97_33165, partial [Planctomycetota bacterium]|nr:hypothetical protein [Planctomycetota bacterium]